jgi:hypothetical protein
MKKNIVLTEREVAKLILEIVSRLRPTKKTLTKEEKIEKLFESTNPKKAFKEIKYFSRDGSSMPNGSAIQRGGFLHECRMNKEAFVIDEAIHSQQYGLGDYRGGIIVFSTTVNAVSLDKNKIKNKVKQILATIGQRFNAGNISHKIINKFNKYNETGEYIGAYSVGNAFKGKYVGDNGEQFDERSITIEVGGLSTKGLLRLGEMIAKVFHQETVLIKDMNNFKFYLANSTRVKGEPDFSNINKKV